MKPIVIIAGARMRKPRHRAGDASVMIYALEQVSKPHGYFCYRHTAI